HAVIQGNAGDRVSGCALKDEATDRQVFTATARASGPVRKWRDWYYWTLDFDPVTTEGKYYLGCASSSGPVRSFPFTIQRDLLERNTLSHVIYYFKGQRSSGLRDQADRHLRFDGNRPGTLDAHGGW